MDRPLPAYPYVAIPLWVQLYLRLATDLDKANRRLTPFFSCSVIGAISGWNTYNNKNSSHIYLPFLRLPTMALLGIRFIQPMLTNIRRRCVFLVFCFIFSVSVQLDNIIDRSIIESHVSWSIVSSFLTTLVAKIQIAEVVARRSHMNAIRMILIGTSALLHDNMTTGVTVPVLSPPTTLELQ